MSLQRVPLYALCVTVLMTAIAGVPAQAGNDDPIDDLTTCWGAMVEVRFAKALKNPLVSIGSSSEGVFRDTELGRSGLFVFPETLDLLTHANEHVGATDDAAGDSILYVMTGTAQNFVYCGGNIINDAVKHVGSQQVSVVIDGALPPDSPHHPASDDDTSDGEEHSTSEAG